MYDAGPKHFKRRPDAADFLPPELRPAAAKKHRGPSPQDLLKTAMAVREAVKARQVRR